MSQLLLAPNEFKKTTLNNYYIFLAGSMGNWREQVLNHFESFSDTLVFLDPTRNDWTEDWNSEQIKEQIFWELNGIQQTNLTAIYFEREAQAPISLLELGLAVHCKDSIICCEEGFWKENNVRNTADFFSITCVKSLEEFCAVIEQRFFKHEQNRKKFQIIN